MARVYVSLDLETTGLDPEKDQITEVGALRFRGGHVFDEFHSLVNPGQKIPYQIEELTGIRNADVAQAPKFQAIRARLQRFVGDNPIIGHNIGFDLKFLGKQGLFHSSPRVDTFELASILMPHADRYSLKALAALLNIEDPPTHRALDDARVTHQLFEALLDQARRLSDDIIKDVAKIGARSQWALAPIFQDLARERQNFVMGALGQQLASSDQEPIQPPVVDAPSLEPVSPPQLLDESEMAQILEPGGTISQAFPKFEHRPQQVRMIRAVTDAFNQAYHLLVEAGTGTGKSMAYLIPAIQWAVKNNRPVVISTNTINLQDQILNKDIPDLKEALGLDFRALALKGRSNYVCPRRVDQLRQKSNLSPSELRLLAKVVIWMPNTLTGDRQELFMPDYLEQMHWNQINSNPDLCRAERCSPERCFFARARQAAESAHIIVVNHALLLADIAINNRAIPEYHYLVIDEAHHLEDSVTKQLSFSANKKGIEQILGDLSNNRSSIFLEIERRIKGAGLVNQIADASQLSKKGLEESKNARQGLQRLFEILDRFLGQQFGRRRNQYDQKLRISDKVRNQAAWSNVELAWDDANLRLSEVLQLLGKGHRLWDGLDAFDVENWEDLMLSLNNYRLQIDEIKQNMQLILGEDDQETITWVTQQINNQDISLHAAPLHVGNLVREHLFETKESIVLTSATFRTDNSFDYIKERLSAWDVEEMAVGSPFDYKNSTLVYIPTDMPEPNTPNYQNVFSQTLVKLALATNGRILVLFTAYSHLRQTAKLVQEPLAEADIALYQQGAGLGRRQLLENFKNANRAVLMGTRSFWEGVDIPGKSLSCVVIAKIPFAVPSDPVFQARSETFDNAFAQYSIPEAILHFRQGFGRLIRTRSDLGVVVVMDRRVLSKSYGQAFIDSLPETTLRQGLSADLPALAAEWIDADSI